MDTPLWTPSVERAARTAMRSFIAEVAATVPGVPARYDDVHAWSVRDASTFWRTYARWSGAIPGALPPRVVDDGPMWSARWFEGVRLNYAESLLAGGGLPGAGDEAVVALDEGGGRRALTWDELGDLVGRARGALEREGVGPGDRVAAFAGTGVESLAGLLAAASLGAIFTSCSPDFGFEAASARFGQVEPQVLLASPSARYGGRTFAVADVARRLADALPSLRRLVWLPAAGADGAGATGADGAAAGARETAWSAWAAGDGAGGARFEPLPFDHPLYVLYSSGTTGVPKAIVHRAGGALLTHHKEHRLHLDIRPGDRVLYFSTMGWMMWNWLVSALAQGATVVLYDGSPVWPDPLALWRLAERERLTFFGTSARYLHGSAAQGVRPREHVDLAALRTVASTGSPLSPSGFRYVYDAVKDDVHLASISGGTDIVGCFVLGVPTLRVHAGQVQRPGLGVDLAVYGEDGEEIVEGPGELVCRSKLPSMPLGFWGDDDGARYRAAYFERFPGVWHHGDLVERTPEGGVIVHGRSDATLNPGGVRIGTAELYRPLETLAEVVDACAVGHRTGDDEEIWLLVVLGEGQTLDDALEARIRSTIRHAASPRHVPRRILQVRELPRTRSGKPMETAVRRIVNGEPVPNREAMANPQTCDEIARIVRAELSGGATPSRPRP